MAYVDNNKKSGTRARIKYPLGKASGANKYVIYSTEIEWNDIDSTLPTSYPTIFENGKLSSIGIVKLLEQLISEI